LSLEDVGELALTDELYYLKAVDFLAHEVLNLHGSPAACHFI
jgi:hypothetical protein